MNIAICDDEQAQLDFLCACVKNWGEKRKIDCSVSAFQSANALWMEYETERYDLALLDIQMPGQSGMELAAELRRRNDDIGIIFITGIADQMAQGYDVDAIHYLLKPVAEPKLFEVLDRALARMGVQEKKLLFKGKGDETVAVPEHEVEYLEARSHDTILACAGGDFQLPVSFGEAVSALPAGHFIKCHRSYVVNLRAIRRIGKYEITLDSGRVIPVSRRLYGDVNKAFITFYKGGGDRS
ncbi:MAG: LytR/AlgR family response regulator transcription factor [Clostridia bacterium]